MLFPVVTGWPKDVMPSAPQGFEVLEFARSLDYPRQILVMENGDVIVAEAKSVYERDPASDPAKTRGKAMTGTQGTSANRLTLLRDRDQDGRADERYILMEGLNQPFGLAFHQGTLYIGNTDSLVSVPYAPGTTRITAAPTVLMPLPAGGYNNHWTRNLLLDAPNSLLYVSVGSASNVGEHGMEEEVGRAAIHQVDLKTGKSRVYASGLRNPVGMDFDGKGVLWTAVNERDHLGDRLVPDYLVGVKEDGFYGWPYSYYGKNVDPRRQGEAPEMVAKALMPDMALGSHTAALGFVFGQAPFPAAWANGAFIARHGSWNRSQLAGYDVVYVPFEQGKPVGEPVPFLTKFIEDRAHNLVNGRPVSLKFNTRGELLVVDDAGGRIWVVRAQN